MAFSAVTALGTAGVDTGGGNCVITTSADAEVGRLVVVLIGKDNVATADGTGSEITSVVDSTGANTYVSAGRFVNGQGAANAGAYVDVYYSVIASQLNSGGTITITKSTDVDCCATAYKATMGAGSTVAVSQVQTQANDNADAASLATSSLANVEHLHIRAVASEYENANNLTVTDGTWTVLQGVISSTAGLPAVNMRIDGEYKISTSTGETSDPTMPSSTADRANVLIAFTEVIASKISLFMHHYKTMAAA
jgi:hypothetical protein